jgi:branched-chain amino acid transport system substrate-binding protein
LLAYQVPQSDDCAKVGTFFTPYQVKIKPDGLQQFLKWAKKTSSPITENALAGWTNADLFYQGLKAAGPDFTRQKVVDAITQMKNYTAGGIYPPIDWAIAHTQDPPQGCGVLSKIHNHLRRSVCGANSPGNSATEYR